MSSITGRVRALLAKAESTPYPAEAEALLAKAQELITRHAIDTAELSGPCRRVGHETITFEGSYSQERTQIWNAVARANRCMLIMLRAHRGRSVQALTLIGSAEDRELTRLLSVSLETQALARLPHPRSHTERSDIVRLRRSFLLGFAHQVANRLEAAVASTHEAAAGCGLPAVTDRFDELESYARANFEFSWSGPSRSRIDGAGYDAGRRHATRADLGQPRVGSRGALPAPR